MDSFGYTLIQEPLNSLNISYYTKSGEEVSYISENKLFKTQ